MTSRRLAGPVSLALTAAVLTGCEYPSDDVMPGELTLAFAGDVHFERDLAAALDDPDSTLGPMSEHLQDADLAMVNLESALAEGGQQADKELEDPSARFWFRSPPAALDVLDRSGVDVVTVANNHGADYGPEGLEETLAAAEDGPVAVVGAGRDAADAYTPHLVTLKDTDIAIFAADAAFRESADPVWAVGEDGPGIASARPGEEQQLLRAVGVANLLIDVIVVYLHWGEEGQRCPTDEQRSLAEALASAGADVVVGSHAHVLLGAGMLDDTYVSYGLGNFQWYNASETESGVLEVRVAGGEVVSDQLVPARTPAGGGQAQPLDDADQESAARSQWRDLQACAGLAPVDDGLPAFESEVQDIDAGLQDRMSSSHDEESCPVPWSDLRYLTVSYVNFDGAAQSGELVVHADHAADVVSVFEELYAARFPIRRMRLVDDYGGDDDASMAANNTSAYNCRSVAGQESWSAHAYGAAVDINPVQNPYVVDGEVRPADGVPFASVDRSPGVAAEPGVITEDDVVTSAFARIGWTWGGTYTEPDYQHFSAR